MKFLLKWAEDFGAMAHKKSNMCELNNAPPYDVKYSSSLPTCHQTKANKKSNMCELNNAALFDLKYSASAPAWPAADDPFLLPQYWQTFRKASLKDMP